MSEPIEPCPNPECGGECYIGIAEVRKRYSRYVYCFYQKSCGYSSPRCETDSQAIALHNRIARAVREAGELRQENERLTNALLFVERWACHHGSKMRDGKPLHSAGEILGLIQHYPTIKNITKSYVDGVVPSTPDPFERAEKVEAERDVLRALIGDAYVTMRHAQTFIESREKMHPTGRDLYADLLERLRVAKKDTP